MLAGWLNTLRLTSNHNIGNNVYSRIFVQTRDYAARKGTREKARKKKIKAALEKAEMVTASKRQPQKKAKPTVSPLLALNESSLQPTTDDVWVMKLHPQPIYSLKEAIELHRETHHPTMFNKPNAMVNAFIELNMKYEKRNKYIERFTNLVNIPHVFEHGKKFTTLALSKNFKYQEDAKAAGADYVGGTEVIKQIQVGKFDFKEYDYVVAHADILTELLLIRGLLKKKFPNTKLGTLGNDLPKLVMKFKNAVRYTATPHEVHKDYGQIDVVFGTLDMDVSQLEENFAALVNNVEIAGVKRQGPFIQRLQVTSSPSPELLKIDFDKYLPKKGEDEEPEPESVGVIETE